MIKYIYMFFFAINLYSFNESELDEKINNNLIKIHKLSKDNNFQEYKEIDLNYLDQQKKIQFNNLLAFYLYEKYSENSLFGSKFFLLSTIGFSVASALTFYFFDEISIDSCDNDCPASTTNIDYFCYADGLDANCAEYYKSYYQQSTIPPFPSYIKNCSSSLPLSYIGKTIPYQTPQSICNNDYIILNTLKGLSILPAIGSLCGLVFHSGMWLKNKYYAHALSKTIDNFEPTYKSEDPQWFKDVIEQINEFIVSKREQNKLNV